MSPIKLTIMILVSVTVMLIGYDVVMVVNDVSNRFDTISGRMRIWGLTAPFVPFVWGILGGHFFGPKLLTTQLGMSHLAGIVLMVAAGWIVLIGGIIAKHEGVSIAPWIMLIPGILIGAICWAQP